jgi:predicted nucleic acid-binding protein
MSRSIVILDSNTIMYHLNKELDLAVFLTAYPDCEKHISVATEIEVLSKPNMMAEEERETQAFLSGCIIEDISPAIKQEAIAIRRAWRLRLPDAVIAATAVTLNALAISKDSHLINLKWPGFHSQEIA